MRLGIVMVVLVATVGSAEAMCADPRDVLTPRSGEVLPPNPALYLFTLDAVPPVAALVDGRPVVVRREYLGRMNDFVVAWRLRVPAASGRLQVIIFGRVVEYRVDPSWRRPPAAPMRIRREVSRSSWTCSYEDAVFLSPSVRAPAYRIDWAPSKRAFDDGRRTTQFFPAWTYAFFGHQTGDPWIGLGHLDCFGHTFTAPPLGVYMEITPLFADGDTPYVRGPVVLSLAVHHWDLALRAGWMFGLCLVSLGLFLRVVHRRRRF